MNRLEYKTRLIAFNNTEKYRFERDFLVRLINPVKNERILDYGTGLGRMVYYLNEQFETNCFGFDTLNLREKDDQFLFRSEYFFQFDKVFFMHSIAHIPEVEEKLSYLRNNLRSESKVFVITPNKAWLSGINTAKEYIADPTLVRHFTAETLQDLFVECGFKISAIGQFGPICNGIHERLFLEAEL